MRVGDLVPEITLTKVMASPGDAEWRHENLIGRVTVFVFFPNVYDATEVMAQRWNELVERFADRVQFVLIARDDKSKLKPWLQKNPFKGWLLLDANWDTARTWGVEISPAVFVDATGRMLGFSQHLLPVPYDIEEILAGRVSKHLRAKPDSAGGDKPDVPPSYTVHISPTKRAPEEGTSQSSGPDHWTALGFELKAVIAQVYGVDASRIEFPADFNDGERYDFAVLLPQEATSEKLDSLVQRAIERYFRLAIAREVRSKDAYVVTAPDGPGPFLKEAEFAGGGFMGLSGAPIPWHSPDGTPPTLEDLRRARVSISEISGSGMTIAFLCSAIEDHLDHLVIDETALQGSYDFRVLNSGNSNEEFFQALHDQLGLVAMPDRRDVTMLVVRRA